MGTIHDTTRFMCSNSCEFHSYTEANDILPIIDIPLKSSRFRTGSFLAFLFTSSRLVYFQSLVTAIVLMTVYIYATTGICVLHTVFVMMSSTHKIPLQIICTLSPPNFMFSDIGNYFLY